jgi:hypothetical protein
MDASRTVFSPGVRLSYLDVLPILEGWKRSHCPVRIEKHPDVYDGVITAVAEKTGKLEFAAVVVGGKKVIAFEFAGADFEQCSELGEDWDDAFMVFLQSGEWLWLRKRKL